MKRSELVSAALLVAAILLCTDGSIRAAVKIASAGADKAIVVVAPNASVPEKHAADELAQLP